MATEIFNTCGKYCKDVCKLREEERSQPALKVNRGDWGRVQHLCGFLSVI